MDTTAHNILGESKFYKRVYPEILHLLGEKTITREEYRYRRDVTLGVLDAFASPAVVEYVKDFLDEAPPLRFQDLVDPSGGENSMDS